MLYVNEPYSTSITSISAVVHTSDLIFIYLVNLQVEVNQTIGDSIAWLDAESNIQVSGGNYICSE